MKVVSLVLFTFILTSCATTAKYEANLQTWVGRNSDSLIKAWGVPSQVFDMPGGGKAIVFGYTGPTNYTVSYNQFLNAAMVNSYSHSCITTFFTDSYTIIESWQWRGNACKSK
jgi:hypothetical protein